MHAPDAPVARARRSTSCVVYCLQSHVLYICALTQEVGGRLCTDAQERDMLKLFLVLFIAVRDIVQADVIPCRYLIFDGSEDIFSFTFKLSYAHRAVYHLYLQQVALKSSQSDLNINILKASINRQASPTKSFKSHA